MVLSKNKKKKKEARGRGGNFNKRQIGCKSGEKRKSGDIQRTKQEDFKDFLIVSK